MIRRRHLTPRTPTAAALWSLFLLAANFVVWALLYYCYLIAS